jgi:hypothetical protein
MQILDFMFSGFWTFVGCVILLDLTIGNIFKVINNYFKMRCIAKLSKDSKTTEKIEMLFKEEGNEE